MNLNRTTKVCPRCHLEKDRSEFARNRTAKDGLNWYCRPCASAATRRSRAKHPDRNREYQRAWYAAHRTYAAARQMAYVQARPEHYRTLQRERYRRLGDRLRASAQARRDSRRADLRVRDRAYYAQTRDTRRAQAREKYERILHDPARKAAEWQRINDLGHRRRAQGGKPSAETRAYSAILRGDLCVYCGAPAETIDHIVPIAQGGVHTWENLTAACRSCNSSKSDKTLLLFLAGA